jgi:site-specific recombinase XerD
LRLSAALDACTLQLRANGRADATVAQYARVVGLLDRWLLAEGRSRRVERLDHATVAAFMASESLAVTAGGRPRKATAQNTIRSVMRSFLGYCHEAGFIPNHPGRLIRRARCAPPLRPVLTEDGAERLLATIAAHDGPVARRDRMLVSLLWRTGLRISSATGLRWDDVDLDRAEISARRIKGDAPMLVPIPRGLVRELRTYRREATSDWVFPGYRGRPIDRRHAARRIAAWGRAAGLGSRATAHALRHGYATALYQRTGDVLLVQRALGHASITSTMVYARLDAERLRQALTA